MFKISKRKCWEKRRDGLSHLTEFMCICMCMKYEEKRNSGSHTMRSEPTSPTFSSH